jgi:hypothetical protein
VPELDEFAFNSKPILMQYEHLSIKTHTQTYRFRRVFLFGEVCPATDVGVHLYVRQNEASWTPVLVAMGALLPFVTNEEPSWSLAKKYKSQALFTLNCDNLFQCREIMMDIQDATALPVVLMDGL